MQPFVAYEHRRAAKLMAGAGPKMALHGSFLRSAVAGTLLLALVSAGTAAQETAAQTNPLQAAIPGGHLRFGFQGGAQVVDESGLYWGLARIFAPSANFDPNRAWSEFYVQPSVTAETRLSERVTGYGGLSLIASGTRGYDAFDRGNTGRALMEDYYAGLRLGGQGAPVRLDLSGGAQPYRIGDGMLLYAGASNGFERGALIFAPRLAWAGTGIARITAGPVEAHAYFLKPNDLASDPTDTSIGGGLLQWNIGQGQALGATAGKVLTSKVPSVQAVGGPLGAPPQVIPNGREGLEYLQLFGRWNPLPTLDPGLWVAGDLALERNTAINLRAWAARAEVGRAFDLPWHPRLSLTWSSFSGDNPATARNERFDPLYFRGSPTTWASGGNASLALINSNLYAIRAMLNLSPTPRDQVEMIYWHLGANQLYSPLQFGQGTRTAANGDDTFVVVSGVPRVPISDDLLVQYTRVLTANMFLTAGIAGSWPGAGIRALVRGAPVWLGTYANLVVQF